MFRIKLIFLLSTIGISAIAQKETTYWFFFQNAGIEFTNGFPVADTNMNDSCQGYFLNGIGYGTNSICSMSDAATGKLLFYGSSTSIYNSEHRSMPNGLPLATSVELNSGFVQSSTEEGSIILPRPKHLNQYYFIHLRTATSMYDDGQISGAFATLVDMELDNGLGDVVGSYKNVLITDSTEEKLSATPHANGVDYWLMLRQGGTNNYHAFLVTENGVSPSPVTTSLGTASTNYSSMQGNIRFNHSGTMMVHTSGNRLDVFDFDDATGKLSNLREIPNASFGWGMEFSADDSKLYGGGPVQYDLSVPTQSAIAASETILFLGGGTKLYGLQMGLDGKIYGNDYNVGAAAAYSVGCIHNPNALGAACNYEDSVVYLEGKIGYISVPQYLSSFFRTNFYTDPVCVGDTARFDINFTFIDSVFWNFGDPGSGAANTSALVNPTHVYEEAGTYTVMLIAQNGVKTDTVVKTIEVGGPPEIDLGLDTAFCAAFGDSVKLGLNGLPGSYLWNTGSTDSVLLTDSAGVYSLVFTNACGSDTDSVALSTLFVLDISLPTDTATCEDSVLLVPTIENESEHTQYLWDNGMAQRNISVFRTGQKQMEVSAMLFVENSCGKDSASAVVTFLPQPDGFLPEDTVLCKSIPLFLQRPSSESVSYEWGDGSSDTLYRADSSGLYTLSSLSPCGALTDSILITFSTQPKGGSKSDTAVCADSAIALVLRSPEWTGGAAYQWSTGEVGQSIQVTDTGRYSVTVSWPGCEKIIAYRVRHNGCYERCKPYVPNVFTPDGDGWNDQLRVELKCDAVDFRFIVLNRWGAVMFLSQTLDDGWDGMFEGKAASEGVYFFEITYKDEVGTARRYNGSASLLR